MQGLTGLTLFCLAVGVFASPRIFGGTDAPDGKYPHMVALKIATVDKDLAFLCGGSILNKRYVITAAHCLVQLDDDEVTVVAGTISLRSGEGHEYKSEQLIVHEDYHDISNDVGLVRLSEDIEFGKKVRPIQLTKRDFYKVGASAVVTGWGDTGKQTPPERLQELRTIITDQESCAQRWLGLVDQSHICTYTKNSEGACIGDSGSPLVADGALIGIVTFVNEFCDTGYPEVNTRIYPYLGWIELNTSK